MKSRDVTMVMNALLDWLEAHRRASECAPYGKSFLEQEKEDALIDLLQKLLNR